MESREECLRGCWPIERRYICLRLYLPAAISACGVLTPLEINLSQIFPSRGAIRGCRKRLDVRTVGCRFRHRQGASSGADWLRGYAWAV
jgi:hypothetical protein